MLKEQGINKQDVTREEFVEHAWEWTRKYGGIILQQLRKLGASCDWDRTQFTMDPHYYEDVIKVFVDLYRKGLIYRGVRMVNWDPQGQTALSQSCITYAIALKEKKIPGLQLPPAGRKPFWVIQPFVFILMMIAINT